MKDCRYICVDSVAYIRWEGSVGMVTSMGKVR